MGRGRDDSHSRVLLAMVAPERVGSDSEESEVTDTQISELRAGMVLLDEHNREWHVNTDARLEDSGQNVYQVWIHRGSMVVRLTYRQTESWRIKA
jgi:hypothetical protein